MVSGINQVQMRQVQQIQLIGRRIIMEIKLNETIDCLEELKSEDLELIRNKCIEILEDRGWFVEERESEEEILDKLEDDEAVLEMIEYYDNHDELDIDPDIAREIDDEIDSEVALYKE